MGIRIYLDDERNPRTEDFSFLCRSYEKWEELLKFCVKHVIQIDYISFDHDLGTEETGYSCAKLLCDYDMDNDLLSNKFEFNVHSANPVGRENITAYLNNYLAQKENLNVVNR